MLEAIYKIFDWLFKWVLLSILLSFFTIPFFIFVLCGISFEGLLLVGIVTILLIVKIAILITEDNKDDDYYIP